MGLMNECLEMVEGLGMLILILMISWFVSRAETLLSKSTGSVAVPILALKL
jgi:hypothetical protein